jgi:hypothetical protein
VIFLRAFFEGQLFDRALRAMMTWNPISFLRWRLRARVLPAAAYFWLRPLPEFAGTGSTGSFAFTCPSRSIYLAGTVNQIASPAKPFFLMISFVRAAVD